MKILRMMAAAFSLYSRIPVPHFEMNEEDMPHSLVFFPLVGLVIGALVFIINGTRPLSSLPVAVRIILSILIPVIITGGFHIDGFMDTEDAMKSYAPAERRLEILKDPHIGAFAVISLVKWLLIYAAAVTLILLNDRIDGRIIIVWGLVFVISRCLSGLSAFLFVKAKRDGMLYEEAGKKSMPVIAALVFQLLLSAGAAICMDLFCGTAVAGAFAVCTVFYRYRSYRDFGGVTGDTAGYFVTVSEIAAAACLAAALYIR